MAQFMPSCGPDTDGDGTYHHTPFTSYPNRPKGIFQQTGATDIVPSSPRTFHNGHNGRWARLALPMDPIIGDDSTILSDSSSSQYSMMNGGGMMVPHGAGCNMAACTQLHSQCQAELYDVQQTMTQPWKEMVFIQEFVDSVVGLFRGKAPPSYGECVNEVRQKAAFLGRTRLAPGLSFPSVAKKNSTNRRLVVSTKPISSKPKRPKVRVVNEESVTTSNTGPGQKDRTEAVECFYDITSDNKDTEISYKEKKENLKDETRDDDENKNNNQKEDPPEDKTLVKARWINNFHKYNEVTRKKEARRQISDVTSDFMDEEPEPREKVKRDKRSTKERRERKRREQRLNSLQQHSSSTSRQQSRHAVNEKLHKLKRHETSSADESKPSLMSFINFGTGGGGAGAGAGAVGSGDRHEEWKQIIRSQRKEEQSKRDNPPFESPQSQSRDQTTTTTSDVKEMDDVDEQKKEMDEKPTTDSGRKHHKSKHHPRKPKGKYGERNSSAATSSDLQGQTPSPAVNASLLEQNNQAASINNAAANLQQQFSSFMVPDMSKQFQNLMEKMRLD